MKRLLILLLLTTVTYGQVATGNEAEFDYGIKNNSAQIPSTVTYLVTSGTTGVYGKTTPSSNIILNSSGVAGTTTTDALNSINSNKANLSGATFTGAVIVPTPTASTHAVTKAYADGLVVGLLDDRGSYNASTNLFPTTGGSGTSGAVLKGDLWYVSVAGTLAGKAVAIGDSFRALTDTPGQTAGNWSMLSANLSYVPANDANVVHKTGSENIAGSKNFSDLASFYGLVSSSPGVGAAIAGLTISNTYNGRGLYSENSGTGDAIVANTTASGIYNYVGQNNNVNNFTVGRFGNINGASIALANLTQNYIPKSGVAGLLGNSLIYDNGTNVGIGTISPNRKLEIKSVDSEQLVLTSTNASNLAGLFLNPANTTFSAFIGGTGNGIVFHTNGTEKVSILGNGNALIGSTTDNGTKLQVNGGIDLKDESQIIADRTLYFGSRTANNFGVGMYFNNAISSLIFYNGVGGGSILELNRTGAANGSVKIPSFGGSGDRNILAAPDGTLKAGLIQPLIYIGIININNTSVSLSSTINQLGGGVPTITSTGSGTATITFPSGSPMTTGKTLVTMGSYGTIEGGSFQNSVNTLGVVARVGGTPTTASYVATIKIEVYP